MAFIQCSAPQPISVFFLYSALNLQSPVLSLTQKIALHLHFGMQLELFISSITFPSPAFCRRAWSIALELVTRSKMRTKKYYITHPGKR